MPALSLNGQIFNPVTWEFGAEKKGDGRYELIFTATIEKGAHIYSMDIPQSGPIPTTFRFDSTGAFSLDGKPFEVTKAEEKFDEAFGFKIKTFEEKAEFRQKIVLKSASFNVTGVVNFMSCNNATCLPPTDVEFSIKVSDPGFKRAQVEPVTQVEPVQTEQVTPLQQIRVLLNLLPDCLSSS